MSAEEVGKSLLGEVVEVGADEVSSDRTISTMIYFDCNGGFLINSTGLEVSEDPSRFPNCTRFKFTGFGSVAATCCWLRSQTTTKRGRHSAT
jgi:hypothetical protein